MSKKIIKVGNIDCGAKELFLISGPCVIEDDSIMMRTAEKLKEISQRLNIPLIFKSSFQKDNRSSLKYYLGPRIEEGLKVLEKIKKQFDLPILSDVHYPDQMKAAGEVLDVIQIPAYLCMQTDLLVAAAQTGKVINIKHGQFLSPENMIKPAEKAIDSGNSQIILTERGFTFGYNDLIVDPRSFYYLAKTGFPVVFDVTHSIRKYGIPSSDPNGGAREFLPVLARAAVGAGVDGLFVEAHPNPPEALCDAASQYYLDHIEEFLKPLLEIHAVAKKYSEF
ncbi:MAG: 3-deoxy-8-phosphooctulonate synthase [Cytophagales bacterium]